MENNQQAQNDPNEIGATEIVVPLGLSIFCGIGGFVWGLVRLAQGHKKPGWVAVGINAGVMMLGFIAFIGITAAGVTAMNDQAGSGSGAATGDESTGSASESGAEQRPTIETTASDIAADYKANEIKANSKYKGKNVIITGSVSGIDADIMDDPVVKLSTGEMFQSVSLHGIPAPVAAELTKGDKIVAQCGEVGEVVGSPVLRECTVD